MDKRGLFIWSSYDFANSLVQINWLLYLSQWLVVDKGLPEIWYGAMYSFVTFLLLLTSPVLGVWADRLKRKMPVLLVMSLVIAITSFGIGSLAVSKSLSGQWIVLTVMGLFLISNYFYQASLVFFNAILPTLGKISFLGRMSGWGEFANNAGLIIGVLLTLPFVKSYGRAYVFLPSAFAFLLFAAPFFLFFKEKAAKGLHSMSMGLGKEAILLIRSLPKFPSMMWFLIGFYFVSDAVRTLILFFPLYFEKVLLLSDSVKAILTMFSLFFMMVGAAIGGWVADKFGTKKTLLWLVILSVVLLLTFVLYSTMTIMGWILIGIISVFLGGYFGVSRAMLMRLAKAQSVGKYFGLYNLFERFASFVAPLLFGWILGLFSFKGTVFSYKAAYFATYLLMILGWVFFRKIKEKDIA